MPRVRASLALFSYWDLAPFIHSSLLEGGLRDTFHKGWSIRDEFSFRGAADSKAAAISRPLMNLETQSGTGQIGFRTFRGSMHSGGRPM